METLTYYAAFIPCEGKIAVSFPDVPGCSTWGNTREEAFLHALDALESHLEALADDGDPIPHPSNYETAWALLQKELHAEGMTQEGVVMQLVPVPDVSEKPTRVNVSFRKPVLAMIDKKAEAISMTRSGFLAMAATSYTIPSHG